MKLCINCKHFRESTSGRTFEKCAKPEYQVSTVSMVDGIVTTAGLFCETARNLLIGQCGPNATGFEPSPIARAEERDTTTEAARLAAEAELRDAVIRA